MARFALSLLLPPSCCLVGTVMAMILVWLLDDDIFQMKRNDNWVTLCSLLWHHNPCFLASSRSQILRPTLSRDPDPIVIVTAAQLQERWKCVTVTGETGIWNRIRPRASFATHTFLAQRCKEEVRSKALICESLCKVRRICMHCKIWGLNELRNCSSVVLNMRRSNRRSWIYQPYQCTCWAELFEAACIIHVHANANGRWLTCCA